MFHVYNIIHLVNNRQHNCTAEMLLNARIHCCLRKFLDFLQSMMSICGTGKASKSFLSALLNKKGGGGYVKRILYH